MRLRKLLKSLLIYALGCLTLTAQAQPTHEYFSQDMSFDINVTMPEDYLGHEIGEWHISPDSLTAYMRHLSDKSSRVSMETIGYSHERKAISHVYISSPKNIANLEGILKKHQEAKSAEEDILVLNLAYSVHGNEPSGANASALVAYYLAAAKDDWVKDFLAKTIIIIEPVQNPDGFGRFAVYANQHKGDTENFDTANRTHFEGWPSGRTNHYWFDLNRDWIFAVHPESKARIKAYQKWRPHVLGDYHEMGGNFPTYFFQPGHPKRTHPLTSKENQRITFSLAEFHAKALDDRSQPYLTQERFDDFYYGKGSAYPDATGAIGLLFEQSAVRGHAREIGGVKIRFRDAIANHLTTSLSLMKGADTYRADILNYRFTAQKEAEERAKNDPVKAYIFSDDGDPARAQKLLDILSLHEIPVYGLTADISVGKQSYHRNHAWVVKILGPQYGLVRSLFEIRTTFEDNIFYDVSTWNLPLALNLPYSPLKRLKSISSNPVEINYIIENEAFSEKPPVAYAFEWNQFQAPHLLQAFMADDLHPRLALLPFSSTTSRGKAHKFDAGTIIVQPGTKEGHNRVRQIMARHPQVKGYGLSSAFSSLGPDLGSLAMKTLKPVKPALLVGKGVNPTEAGEIRYAVDKDFGVPLTILDFDRLDSVDLSHYTHFLLADGTYKSWDKIPEILKKWVAAGGIVIAQKNAAVWVEKAVIFAKDDKEKESDKAKPEEKEITRRAYQDYEQDLGKRTISGAVLWTEADLTHPLIFGYGRKNIPVFYNAKKTLSAPPISYDTPLVFANKDLLIAGYADKKRLEKIQNTPAIALHRMGKGKIILLSHNVNFRAIWLGTERLYANALFFTQAIEKREDRKERSR